VFVPASIALIVSPGPDSLYVLSRSISNGRWTGLAAAVGTCTGLLIHTLAAILGLSAILRASSLAYTVVKIAGAVYLVYLGIQTIRQKEEFQPQANDTEIDGLESYPRGAMINVLNPKVAIFFLAFLPHFVESGTGSWAEMLLLGGLFATLALLYLVVLVVVSSQLTDVLRSHPRVSDIIRWAAGSVIIAFGIQLERSDRSPS
jgi:threonine/homoserine/homoserine lactone efflux protein